MNTGGLSRTRLDRMHDVMAGHVERGTLPGLVTLVSRRGEIHVDAIGTTAVGGTDPMRPEVYAAGRHWRRLSVQIGRESGDAAAGQPSSQLFGVKALLWDRRDPTHPSNLG